MMNEAGIEGPCTVADLFPSSIDGIADSYREDALLSKAWPISLMVLGMLACRSGHTAGTLERGPCDDTLTAHIPARPVDAPSGREFLQRIAGLDGDAREILIREQLLAGNVPHFLRHLQPVRFEALRADGHLSQITLCVAPDYLAIGSDSDFVLMPMRLETALQTADHFGFTLPTPKMVDAIYQQASVHYAPQPLPAGDTMRSTAYYQIHNELIDGQRANLGASTGELSAGDKKDLVITARLWQHLDRVAIYGWHMTFVHPIQPLSTLHGWHYADYSHGARLVSLEAFADGVRRSLLDILQDPQLAGAVSSEGAIPQLVELLDALSTMHTAPAARYIETPAR